MINLKQVRIWDGDAYCQADTLQMDRGRITFIGEAAHAPPGGVDVDCSGLTAIPGLIDAHVHMELDPQTTRPPTQTGPDVIPHMRERAAAMAAAGITTARDLGGGAWYELDLRDAIARGELTGPRLLCAGQPITTPHGHCHFWGGTAADIEQGKQVLQRQRDHQVDLIKIMATGGRMTHGSAPADAQFSQAHMSELVALARAAGLPVAAHCHGTEGIRRAAVAGVDTIEHCSWVGPKGWASDYQADVAKIILDQGVRVSPTINAGWQRMLNNPQGSSLARVRQAFTHMRKLGIPLIASTDAGIPGVFHDQLARALLVFCEIVQMTPEQTLRSATSDSASALGIDHITGRLHPGLAADILLVDGDPLQDLTVLQQPALVYCAGVRI